MEREKKAEMMSIHECLKVLNNPNFKALKIIFLKYRDFILFNI